MAKVSVKEYARALYMALQESRPEDADMVIKNLVAIMQDNGDLAHYEAVIAEYEVLASSAEAVQQVEAIFAKQATASKGLLDELNDIVGPQLEIRSKIDSELVGGMVLRVDDTLIDASVKGNLDRMKRNLAD